MAGGGDPARSDLEGFIRVVRRRAWLIAVCVATTALVAIAVSLLEEERYTATASLLFRDPGFAQNLFGTDFQAQTDPTREAATNVKLVGLDVIAGRTAEDLGRGLTQEDVSAAVKVSEQGQSDVVSIDATDHDPALARRIANTFAQQFIAFRAQADRSKLLQAKGLAEREFENLSPEERGGPRGTALSSAAERLGVLASLQTGNAELVQPAELPAAPSSPRPARNGVLGLLVGLLLGTGLAFLFERLNRRLRDADEARDEFGLPIIGTIPRSDAIDSGLPWLPFPEEEAFRTLRAALRYFDVDRDVRSVVVTSASAEEGKSTVAWNLARAAASTSNTILVEADLRYPSLAINHAFFPSPGLAELLTHQAPLHAAVQTVDVTVTGGSNGGRHGLDVIVAGQTPPNPPELLESQAMRELLADLARRYEFVVVDTPPTGVVSDAFPLLTQVSGVIVVGRIGKTTRDAAAKLRNQLQQLRAPMLGVVANCVKQSRRRSRYGYGSYEGFYGAASEEEVTIG